MHSTTTKTYPPVDLRDQRARGTGARPGSPQIASCSRVLAAKWSFFVDIGRCAIRSIGARAGSAVARAFAREGARVLLAGRSLAKVEADAANLAYVFGFLALIGRGSWRG